MTDDIKPKRKSPARIILHIVLTLVLSAGTGSLVWFMSSYIAWQNVRSNDGISPKQWETQEFLRQLNQYMTQNQLYSNPASFSLELFTPDDSYYMGSIFSKQDDQWLDGWDRPFVTENVGKTLQVKSFGRDGQLGGIGLDHDLSDNDPNPYAALLTYSQFLDHQPAEKVRQWCYYFGLGAAIIAEVALLLIVFVLPKVSEHLVAKIIAQVVSVFIIVIASAMVGGFISALHVPLPPYAGGH